VIRTILYAILFVLVLLLTFIYLLPPYFFLWLIRKEKAKMAFLETIYHLWGKTMIYMTGAKVEVEGLSNLPKGNALFICDHQSYMDILLITGFIPRLIGFIAKVELKKIPILGMWMGKIGCIFLNRKSLRDSANTITEGAESLKRGNSMIIFPEGTRNKGGPLKDFKPGSLKLAFLSGVPIVPLTINGTYKLWEEKNRIKPAKVKLTIHQPINTEKLTEEQKKGLIKIIQKQVESAL
jgi:1-acyl-sn-glycerol-3-phosphate acyltransferase